MIENKLSKLQLDFLHEFFSRDSHFFLTGGAALAGFYLGHRRTEDLDLFTLENEIDNGVRLVYDVAASIGATVQSIQTAPDFRRFLVDRANESVVIDLVREYVFQVNSNKPVVNGVRIDSAEEILANKLCTLLSRSEVRDLIDVYELERSGLDIVTALEHAGKKDSGMTAGQLAWVLGQIELGERFEVDGNLSSSELQQYLSDLIGRLTLMAYP